MSDIIAREFDLIEREEVTRLIDVHPATLRRWAAKGVFPKPLKISTRIYWRRIDIEAWLDKNINANDRSN